MPLPVMPPKIAVITTLRVGDIVVTSKLQRQCNMIVYICIYVCALWFHFFCFFLKCMYDCECEGLFITIRTMGITHSHIQTEDYTYTYSTSPFINRITAHQIICTAFILYRRNDMFAHTCTHASKLTVRYAYICICFN